MDKPVVNIFSLINAELERLHAIARGLELESRSGYSPSYHHSSGGAGFGSGAGGSMSNLSFVYQKIDAFNNAIVEAFKTHDVKIQEKVAELALMDAQKESV